MRTPHHSWTDAHMIKAEKGLLHSLYITIGAFFFIFSVFHIGEALYVSKLATQATEKFKSGIAQDLAYLKQQGDEVAASPVLKKYIVDHTSEELVAFLKEEKNKRQIGSMSATNHDGIILGRTRSAGVVGDNVFLTNPVARVVAKGNSAESVEAPVGFAPEQIFLNTGRPVFQDGKMIGALFASYLTDDDYAKRFQKTYLSNQAVVIFYNKTGGVYGNGFTDPEIRKTISSYFNSGSDWVQKNISEKTVTFNEREFYLVQNVIFPGLEESPGGAFLFIPRSNFFSVSNLLTLFLTLVVFIITTLRHHWSSRGEERGWRYYVLVFVITLPILAVTAGLLYLENLDYMSLKRVSYELYNSTLRLQPEFGIYDTTSEQRITVVADTGDEKINAVELGLVFDPEQVEIKALEATSSVCAYVVESAIDNDAGTAAFTCGIITTGGQRGSLPIVEIVTHPKKVGTFALNFDQTKTKVLASDGLGTNVLRLSQAGSYRVDNFEHFLFNSYNEASHVVSSTAFVVFSPTHPNQSRWYNGDTARFVWRGNPDTVYKYAFDTTANTTPSSINSTKNSDVTVPIPGDGVFYFHLQAAVGGAVAHYRIQADRTPPSVVTVEMSENSARVGDVVRFSFGGEDVSSGIQKNFYIDLGNHLFLPIGPQLFIPFLERGEKKIVVRVYDNAGNYAEKTQTVYVKNKP